MKSTLWERFNYFICPKFGLRIVWIYPMFKIVKFNDWIKKKIEDRKLKIKRKKWNADPEIKRIRRNAGIK